MNNEWTTILGFGSIICAMFLVYGSYILWNKRRSKERLLRKIREDWGSWPPFGIGGISIAGTKTGDSCFVWGHVHYHAGLL